MGIFLIYIQLKIVYIKYENNYENVRSQARKRLQTHAKNGILKESMFRITKKEILKMEKQTITIYDVAREAEVSMATVSRVVNGNTNVKPSTRAKVLKVIEELDYRPNAVARGLASKRTTTVGVIIPDVTNLFFSSLALGIDDIASMYNYNIILENADFDHEKQVLSNILAKQVDGVIYMGHHLTDEMRKEIDRSRTPFVLAGMFDPKGEIPSVNIEYKDAIEEVTTKLIKAGKTVAFIAAKQYFNERVAGRYGGYLNALRNNGLSDVDNDISFQIDRSKYNEGYAIGEALKDSGANAVVIIGDEVSIGVLNYLKDQNVKVPEEMSIITSSDSAIVEMARPKLSSIKPPLYDIGAVSMRILTKLMNKEEDVETKVELPYQLIARESTDIE